MAKIISYSEKMREIRALVNFDYDLRKKLSKYQKEKINKYYNKVKEAKGQPVRIYRPKSNEIKKILKTASGFDLPGFKAILIPNPDPENPYRVKIENKKLIFSNKSGSKVYIPFDILNLIENPEKEINAALKKASGDRIAIACGEFEYRERVSNKERARELLLKFITEYGDKTSNHYFGRWLHGIYSVKIKNQELMDKEMIKKAIYRAAPKGKRKELLKKAGKNEKKNSNGRLRN